MIHRLMKAAARPRERLRWKVLSRFGILPGSWRSRLISDRTVLRCAAQMLLDRESAGEAAWVNPAFDQARFERLGGGA